MTIQNLLSLTPNLLKELSSLDDFIVKEMSLNKASDSYIVYPSSKRSSVVQLHFRGKSLHMDYRVDVGDHLIGWTLSAQKSGTVPNVGTLSQGRSIIQGYSPERGNRYLKPMIGKERVFAITKSTHSKKWLSVNGMVEPGEVGATRYEHGLFVIVDKPSSEFGYQSKDFHEYFLTGSKIQWNGILYFRQLDRSGSKVLGEEYPSGKLWVGAFKNSLLPHMLSTDAVRKGTMTPSGISGIPQSLMQQVPTNYKYWNETNSTKAKEVRDALVKERVFTKENIKIVNGQFRMVQVKYFFVDKVISSPDLETGGKKNPEQGYSSAFDKPRKWPLTEKIENLADYDPSNLDDEQVEKDFEIALKWIAFLDKNPRSIKFTRDELIDLLVIIIKELIKRSPNDFEFELDDMDSIEREAFDDAIKRGKIKIPESMIEVECSTVDWNLPIDVFKAAEDTEERIVGGAVLIPNRTDLQGHIYNEHEVRKAAHYFMEEGYYPGGHHGPRLMHQGKLIVDKVRILESFVLPFDWNLEVSFLGKPIKDLTLPKGSWIIFVRILDDLLWQDIKKKKYNAFSIGGFAHVNVLKPAIK